MRCPNCDQTGYHPAELCPNCQFSGDPERIEELAHIDWLLHEIDAWPPSAVRKGGRQRLEERYTARRRELEIALELRPPPFTAQEARQAWPELCRYEALSRRLAEWLEAGLLDPANTQAVVDRTTGRIDDLRGRLEGHPRPDFPLTDADRLDVVDFLLENVDDLRQRDGFATPDAAAQIQAALAREKESLEIQLGLRPPPERESVRVGEIESAERQVERAASAAAAGERAVPPMPPAPAMPFRERLWRTLASERTLRAILFLGIFLLLAAALSFVIWGWRDFSPLLRISIPTGFTALCFALGWYVRTRMSLYRSGVALSAIASLLVPIDSYTAFVNLEIPPGYGPEFWLATSLFCLCAYVVVTLTIQSRLFGYLVGTAAGSAVLAAIEIGHQAAGLSRDWSTAGLSVLAVGMLLVGTVIARLSRPGRWRVLADPLRYLALLTVGVLMPLTLCWRLIHPGPYDTLHDALTINWWLGGFIFGWGAVYHRSRGLGLLAAIALPVAVYLAQAAAFDRMGVDPAWHALGWACLVPLYFVVGRRLSARVDDEVVQGHGRTATGWGIALSVVAALWSFADLTSGAAAASSHAVLAGAVVLAAALWRRPRTLYAASLLSLSAATFAMAEWGLTIAQLGVGWASWALIHVVIALNLGHRSSAVRDFSPPLVVAGYAIAALALLPPLFPYDGALFSYALGNWIGLAAWGARLAHVGQPGFAARRSEIRLFQKAWPLDWAALFHWLAAMPLPFWLWVLFIQRRPPDFSLPLALAALAWAMVALAYRLRRANAAYRLPWHSTALAISVAAPVVAFIVAPGGLTPALCLLSSGLLYLSDAIAGRHSIELAPAGLVTAWGSMLLLDRLRLSFDAASLALASLISLYFLAGLWAERRRSRVFTHRFLTPLYLTGHALTLLTLGRVYLRPLEWLLFDRPWIDEARTWGAAAQLVLGVVYGLYAWGTYREWWGHVAAWLGTAGGGFLLTVYSRGRGSSAAKAALMAIAFVLAERGLRWLWQHPRIRRRRRAFARMAWHLYRRPLLVAGWTVSAGTIGLALIRNLLLLGGGRVQQTWAAAGLLLVTGLYALSARLFRRARFVWLAAVLVFAPWTILSNLGWFTPFRPTVPGFAIGWAVLSWTLFLVALWVKRLAPRAYALPLRVVAHVLLPVSLLWGVADVDTSRFTFGLAIVLYGVAAWLDGRRYRRAGGGGSLLGATRFRYPALALVPVWCVYLMAWLLPAARHEHYGLMIFAFGPLGLAAGRWLPGLDPSRSSAGGIERLPGYLAGYAALIVGTMLVAHLAPLLALALLFDAVWMVVSARLFRNPLWAYPAAAMVPVSLWISLSEAGVAGERHGWWLIGLAAVYLALAWLLRRARADAYAMSVLAAGFALIALGLLPSSQDQIGALWGYGGAALLYAIAAFWLRQPLLLTPVSALSIVPYAISLQRSSLPADYYGLALFPGALIALALGWLLDARFCGWRGFPWRSPARWAVALAERLLEWWGLPLYALGFGLAAASPFFAAARADLRALNLALLVPLFGWALYRFRLRGWLLAMGVAGHLAVAYSLHALGWWAYPAWAWLRFLPVTVVTTSAALLIEWRRGEGSPLNLKRAFCGWSRPLYLLALADVVIGQGVCLGGTGAGAAVTLAHAALAALLACAWRSPAMPYLSATLGAVALGQWLVSLRGPIEGFPIPFARLALGYGLAGYGLTLLRERLARSYPRPENPPTKAGRRPGGRRARLRALCVSVRQVDGQPGLRPWLAVWERPLQRCGLVLSWCVLAGAAWLGIDLAGWTVRAALGMPFREIVDLATVRMAVGVLSMLGLLYVAASAVYRRVRLGYVAVGMLLAGWMVHAFYVQAWEGLARVQWYALPAGLYLLGIAYLEWGRGNRALARWLDYAAMLLMVGSLFLQTLLFGWRYALMLGGEGFAALWWGSARRLRRFFYGGMVGVVLATLGQLINSLQSIDQWIVFGIIGLLLVVVAAIVERKLEEIRASLQEVLEDWE